MHRKTHLYESYRRLAILAAASLVAVVTVGIWAQAAAAPAKCTIVISAPNRAYAEAPVSATVPAPGQFASVTLRQTKPPATVPCQFEKRGAAVVVTWIVRDLPKGSSRSYELAFSDKPASAADDGVTLNKGDDAVEVLIDDDLFTRYYYRGCPKPALWPIIGPTGKSIVRNYPMTDATPDERKDHTHHRGLFHTHGDVNGVDFWAESGKSGRTMHREFVALSGGPVYGVIKTRNDWTVGQWEPQEPRTVEGGVHLDGWKPVGEPQKLCEDEREIRIYRVASGRLLDYTTTIRATGQELVFGDTKEGSFGIRVAGTMDVDAKLGGRIVNSNGETDGAAWGKAAEWCDYYGPVDGKTVGIAILDHPTSFRHPTTWHVRTYGLFAVNPFGLHDFQKDPNPNLGAHKVAPGETLTFRYRIFIHEGDTEAAHIADVYGAYADPPKVMVK